MAKIIEFYIPSSFRKKATDSRRWYLSHGSEVLLVNADTVSKRESLSHGVAVVHEVGRGFNRFLVPFETLASAHAFGGRLTR